MARPAGCRTRESAPASDTAPVRGVCVLGVSRSGTSAVAGMFVRAGFFAGAVEDVYPPDSSNPNGHHENLGMVLTNERLLWRLGGTIFSPPSSRSTSARGVMV